MGLLALADPTEHRAGRDASTGDRRVRAIVDASVDAVYRTLRGLGVGASEVDDAVQQVYVIVFRRLDAIEQGRERAFAVAVAAKVAANARRSRKRANARLAFDDERIDREPSKAADPETEAVARERRALLQAALERLDDDLREAFVLFELENLTMAQIAEALEIPQGTVASRIRRARERFRAVLTEASGEPGEAT